MVSVPPEESSSSSSSSFTHDWKLKVLTLFVVVAFCVLAIELFLAFFMPVTFSVPVKQSQTSSIHPGRARYTYERNDLGLRTRTLNTLEKQPGTYRILCIGGSTTDETGKGFADSWPGILEESLQDRMDESGRDIRIELGSWARGGERVRNRYLWATQYVDRLQPDLVICLEGINDFCLNGGADYHWEGVESIRTVKQDLKSMVLAPQLGKRLYPLYQNIRNSVKNAMAAQWHGRGIMKSCEKSICSDHL